MPVLEKEAKPKPILDSSDRCDRCGAQAYVKMVLVSGLDLLFCKHDYTKHQEVIDGMAALVHDESHIIS